MENSRKWPREFHTGPTDYAARDQDSKGAVGLLEAEPVSTPESDRAADPETAWEKLELQPEWQLACRVAASKGLSRSELLPQFLLYVCEQYLLGNTSEITEQRIGIQIFNRPADYNPGEDNIVRSYARMLRKRLDAYFDGEGSDEPMRIVIPRGGYVPVFQSTSRTQRPASIVHFQLEEQSSPGTSPASGSKMQEVVQTASEARYESHVCYENDGTRPSRRSRWLSNLRSPTSRLSRSVWLSALAGLAVGILLASAGWWSLRGVQSPSDQEPAHAIWAQLFQPNRNTLIVPSDSGLGILQNLTGHLVNVEEYASGSYLSEMKFPPQLDARNFNDLRRERYTSVVSLNITSMLTRLPEFIANRTQVRYARGITTEDIKNSNVILLGSKHTNPWVSLFDRRLNFRLEYTPEVDESYVLNGHPTGVEQSVYRNSTGATSNHTYGAIAYLPSLDGAGHILIIQGLNMAATQAAADMLFNAGAIKPVLQQAALPNGTLRPFELLIETTSIGATAPGAQLIATRIYPQ
jgi:hypothetical protein